MVFDVFWTSGEILSIVGLLYGAGLVLMETFPLFRLFGKKAMVPRPCSAEDLRLISSLTKSGSTGHLVSGNAMIDRGHQSLAHDMNRLRSAITSRHSRYHVDADIDVVIRGVVQHFKDEETILAAAGYLETAKHAALHRQLVDRAATLVAQFRGGTLGVGELFQFLADDVIAKHMMLADQACLPYLASRQ